ncbi:hypothetical protein UPYG_G00350350 [Umbra pygmaea]|uniref:Uromodulin-like 1 n=1 Tax=Umbra pygmaea TaxID=75934 RepID=A0ABD0WFY9_UMBPY
MIHFRSFLWSINEDMTVVKAHRFYFCRIPFPVSVVLLLVVPHTIYLGSCSNITFSLCWKISLLEGNVWLNTNKLTSIWRRETFSSLTVVSSVEHNVTLDYGGIVQEWIFSIMPSLNTIEFRSKRKPEQQPVESTQKALKLITDNEVFACENSSLYLNQDEHAILMLGYTFRHPIKLESRTAAMLLVSWKQMPLLATADSAPSHSVSLYHIEEKAYAAVSVNTTRSTHYGFTALASCTLYAACVEIAGRHSLYCLSTITDPEVPRHFNVMSRNATSVTVSWDCPENCKFSFFLVTIFYLNGTNHVLEERSFRHTLDSFLFTQSNLTSCSRFKFGLQTVCSSSLELRQSRSLLIDDNVVQSEIEDLRQTGSGPENYTLTWMVRNTSSITMFRIYHQGAHHTTTLLSSHTVAGLQPCTRYLTRVEALCSEDVVVSTKSVHAHTGPRGVSELRYRPEDSTALWVSGTAVAVSFQYRLSNVNGSTIQEGQQNQPWLHLPGLIEGGAYTLDVREVCDGERSPDPALVYFSGVNVPVNLTSLPSRNPVEDLGLTFDIPSHGLDIVVPWYLAGDLRNPRTEPRAELERVVTNRLEELLNGDSGTSRVQLVALDELEGGGAKTKMIFHVFDASITNKNISQPTDVVLEHIQSLQSPNITVNDGIVFWDDPDECATPDLNRCDSESLCINTLDSYTCVCPHGLYDVSSAFDLPQAPPPAPPSSPVCREKGMFAQCLDRLLAGSIAKAFLIGYFGGAVEVILNDGQCTMNETETLYHFHMLRTSLLCGTTRLVNSTCVEFRNTLTVTARREKTITRKHLKVIWKCIYPRNYIRDSQINVDLEWMASHSVVQYNSSHELGLAITMYSDDSFSRSYRHVVTLSHSDTLFFEVNLLTNNTFASEVLLDVVSCWATESPDPQDETKGFFLQNSCSVDFTFQWLSVNGAAQTSRFSVQMFTMPRDLHFYIHCLAQICAHDEDCTRNCSSQSVKKRSTTRWDLDTRKSAIVSAGPLLVTFKQGTGTHISNWEEFVMVVYVVGGAMGILMLTVLGVSVIKAVMNYYEQARL